MATIHLKRPGSYKSRAGVKVVHDRKGRAVNVRVKRRKIILEEQVSTITFASPGENPTSDNIPAPFSFTDTSNQALGSTQTSNSITVLDIGADAHPGFSVFTTNAAGTLPGLFRINGGQWQVGNGVASLNDTIEVQHTASASNNTQVNTTLLFPDGNVSDTFTSTTEGATLASGLILMGFESGTLYEINPADGAEYRRYLWNQYPLDNYDYRFDTPPVTRSDPGTQFIETTEVIDGSYSLGITCTPNEVGGGTVYLQRWPRDTGNIVYNDYGYVRDMEDVLGTSWDLDTYTTMRFFMKIPPGISYNSSAYYNSTFGTYVRRLSDPRSLEASTSPDRWHFYHRFNVGSEDDWIQCHVDMHPRHQVEVGHPGELDYPMEVYDGNTTDLYNYWDLMGRFYYEIDGGHNNPSDYPATFYFDRFEMITNPYYSIEPFDRVSSIMAIYRQAVDEFRLGWTRYPLGGPASATDTTFYIYWADSNIHALPGELNDATLLGSITPPLGDRWANNQMDFTTTPGIIPTSGKSSIFFAIKPEPVNTYCQVEVFLNPAGYF